MFRTVNSKLHEVEIIVDISRAQERKTDALSTDVCFVIKKLKKAVNINFEVKNS